MATDKPRFSVTFSDDSFSKIRQYQKENQISTQSKAVARLVELAIKDMEKSGLIENAPSVSDEAMKIAKRYQDLDTYGKSLVRSVMVEEENRIKEQSVARRQMIQAAAYGGGVNQIPEIHLDEVPTDTEPLP